MTPDAENEIPGKYSNDIHFTIAQDDSVGLMGLNEPLTTVHFS